MRHFTSTELTRMQGTQDSAMQDTCNILTYSTTEVDAPDAYGLPANKHMVEVPSVCGYKSLSPREVQERGYVPAVQAVLRLPIDTEIDERNRIRITYRYAEQLDVSLLFDVEGPILRGPSGIRIMLRNIDDGSDTTS